MNIHIGMFNAKVNVCNINICDTEKISEMLTTKSSIISGTVPRKPATNIEGTNKIMINGLIEGVKIQ